MARRHGSVWLEVAACLRRTTNVSWSWWPTNFHESCLDELYGLIQGGDMRITLSLGSVRVSVCAANPLSQQALRELNSEAFATLCEFATRAKWTDMPIDGVQLFAWHGECVPSFSLPPHIREVRSERAVFFEIAGICTRESGVSMAKVLLRALSAVGCANALTWFVSPDEAFFPDCEIDTEQRAIFVREIEKVGNVLKSDTVALACPQAEMLRFVPTNSNCTVLCLLWYQRASDDERTKALSIAQRLLRDIRATTGRRSNARRRFGGRAATSRPKRSWRTCCT
jgi:hypothetical protein